MKNWNNPKFKRTVAAVVAVIIAGSMLITFVLSALMGTAG